MPATGANLKSGVPLEESERVLQGRGLRGLLAPRVAVAGPVNTINGAAAIVNSKELLLVSADVSTTAIYAVPTAPRNVAGTTAISIIIMTNVLVNFVPLNRTGCWH